MEMASDSVKEQKNVLRRRMLAIRDSQTGEEISARSRSIGDRLFGTKEWKKASKVFFFYGYSSEVRTDFMIMKALKQGKRSFIPRVMSSTEMKFYEIHDLEGLVPDKHGIPKPPKEWIPTS